MGYVTERDWTTKSGLRAVVLRVHTEWSEGGNYRCGYVGITKEHPLHGLGYHDSSPALAKRAKARKNERLGGLAAGPMVLWMMAIDSKNSGIPPCPVYCFDVYGGITFASGNDKYPALSDGLWWFGFDCGHADDGWNPKSEDFCVEQCEHLADQIAAVVSVKERKKRKSKVGLRVAKNQ